MNKFVAGRHKSKWIRFTCFSIASIGTRVVEEAGWAGAAAGVVTGDAEVVDDQVAEAPPEPGGMVRRQG
jgi:hypothetical protein